MVRRRRACALVGVLVLVVGLSLSTVLVVDRVHPAGAVACDTTWNGATADWTTAADWSGGVPTSSSNACLPVGAYTVTIRNNAAAASLAIGSGATLVVINDNSNNNSSLTVGSSVTNAGTIQLTNTAGCGGCFPTLAISGGTLTNTGTLDTESTSNIAAVIAGNIDNQGTFTVNRSVSLNQTGATVTSTGAITIASGKIMAVSGGGNTHSFNFDGGTIVNNGTFTQTGGAFNHHAGTASGNALVLASVAVAPNPTSGSASFLIEGNSTLTSNVAANDLLAIINDSSNNNSSLTVGSSVTNAGTIQLTNTAGCGGCFPTLAISGGTLTNTGTLDTESTSNIAAVIAGNIDNQGTFTVNRSVTIDPGVIHDFGTLTVATGKTITNVDDTLVVEPGGICTLVGTGTYTQQSGATLGVTVNATNTTFTGISGGNTNLAGTLQVTTIGLPAFGSTWPIISGVSRTGTFATLQFGTTNYAVQYLSTGVTLVAQANSATTAQPSTTTGTVTAPSGSGVSRGTLVYDAATVTGNSATHPTGTVGFYVCSPATLAANSATTCSSLIGTLFDAQALPGGSGATASVFSNGQNVNSTGTWCFAAYYGGDGTYPASSDASIDECFNVVEPIMAIIGRPRLTG